MVSRPDLRRRIAWIAVVTALALAATAALPGLTPAAYADGKGKGKGGHGMPPGLAKKFGALFLDLDDASWALPYVEAMWRLSIVQGYGDKSFKPNKPVTQAEALAMVIRALGLEDEALASTLSFVDLEDLWGRDRDRDDDEEDDEDDDHGDVPVWARGYLAVAVEHGLLDWTDRFRPNKPATRAWVAALLVRAAEIDADLKAGLTFADADEIPMELQALVRLAVHLGWFQGYPGNVFKPNKPVTRAEMATILFRFLGYDGVPSTLPGLVRGTITAVDDDDLTLRTALDTRTYPFADDVTVLIDGRSAGVDDLEAGMRAWIRVVDGHVIYVSARTQDEDEDEDEEDTSFEAFGAVEELDTAGVLHITVGGTRYRVDGDVDVVDADGDALDFDDLRIGWVVRVRGEVQNDVRIVTRIEVLDEVARRIMPATLYGIVERTDRFELDIIYTQDGVRDRDLDVAKDLRVYYVEDDGDEVDIDLAALNPGDQIELIYEASGLQAIRRTAAGREEIGIVTDLDLIGTIQDLTIDRNFDADETDAVTYRFAAVVDVSDTVPGTTVDELDELEEGYVVRVTLTAEDRIIGIVVTALEP